MSRTVMRWGQSAYESDLDLGRERTGAEALGLAWRQFPESREPPVFDGVGALVVTSRVRVGPYALDTFAGSLVLTTTSGTDHIDLAAAKARGITVARCPMARRDPVVEQALGGLIGLLRRQPALWSAARAGVWARSELPALAPVTLAGARIVVVGMGVIGRRMAQVLDTLGAHVIGVDPAGVPAGVEERDIDAALADADAVTLHCALTPSSAGLLSAERIARLRPGAVVVNTARGRVLDVNAAVASVQDGVLGGLAVDVFPEEPWPGLARAAAVPGVWLTPHGAGYDRQLGERVAEEVVASLTAWSEGRPLPHVVG